MSVHLTQSRELLSAAAADSPAFSWLEADSVIPVGTITHHDLHHRAKNLAIALQAKGAACQRVLLPFPPGLDFITAFLGCIYAAAIPAPAPFPQNRRTATRAAAIFQDCQPAIILTPESEHTALGNRLESVITSAKFDSQILSLENLIASVSETAPDEIALPPPNPDTVAYLQYTSGTGGTTKGVQVTHANLAHNVAAHQAIVHQPSGQPMLSWLPQYHDMQLVGIIARNIMIGGHCLLMSPVDFLQNPLRWLRAISHHRAFISGGPNFTYDHCVQRTRDADLGGLDLSSWRLAFNCSERIRASTIQRFEQKFSPYGFDPQSWYSAYGLAEGTALVTGVGVGQGIQFRTHPASHQPIANCGQTTLGDQVAIVDPQTGRERSSEEIGEICVASHSVTPGYWNRPTENATLFYQRLAEYPAAGPFLRTGDLGFIDATNNLYMTGRLKDLIIIRGINHLPEDLENSIDGQHVALRPGELAAFSIEHANDSIEHLVIAAEVQRTHRHKPDLPEIVDAVQIALSHDHSVTLDHLILLPPGALPKTTSGKVQRGLCRDQFLDQSLPSLHIWHRNSRFQLAPA